VARIMSVRGPGREERLVLDALGRLDEAGLATLLAARPDLVDPPPYTLDELAARVVGPASVEACREALDLGCRQVHEALLLLPRPTTLGQLAALMSVDPGDHDLAEAIRRLGDRALVGRDGDRLQLFPGPQIRYPAGLGPPAVVALAPQSAPALAGYVQRLGLVAAATKSANLTAIAEALSDPERVAELLAKAPPGAADLVRRLASADGPEAYTAGAVYSGDKTAAGWLANRGVVAPLGWDTVVLVREVGLAVRGGKAFASTALRPPPLPTHSVDAVGVDRAAAERALRVVADITTILDGWAVAPPRQLKAGGLGVQVLRRAAKAVDRTEVETARVVELAAAAGLVSIDAVSDAALPLPAYDRWSALDVAGRWSHLVAAWMRWDLHVSVAGALDGKRKPIPPLLVRSPEANAYARRRRILAALVSAAPGFAVTSETVFAHALWDAPSLWSGGPATPPLLASWVLAEGELLGLCGLGALSTWGRLAVTGDIEGARAAVDRLVPAATSRFVVQADLTALAPAELVRVVHAELESMATLESRGGAGLYRFTEASLRGCFEAGRTAVDILAFLDEHASKGVPQALTYLVNDVARRFGQLRVTATACCLRSDDVSLLAEVVASRPAKALGLRLLAPTVAAATADPATVLAALRGAGYLPAEEGPGGSLVLSRPAPRRARPDSRLAALGRRRPGQTAGFGPVGDPFLVPTGAAGTATATVTAVGRSPAEVAAALIKAGTGQKGRKAPAPPPVPPKAGAATTSSAAPPANALFDLGPVGSRPEQIARDPVSVTDLLQRALVDDWPVRLAYTSKKGRTTQLNASVLDLGDRDVVVELLSGWESRVLALSRIGWVRVLTEAEEDAI